MDWSGGYYPGWSNPITKEVIWYALTYKWILAQKLGIPMKQFIDHMKLKKKEDQSADTLVLLRKGNKILKGRNMEIKYGAETEGKATQRLPHLWIHPIYNHQTQTLLWMPTEPDMTVSWERLPVPNKYRSGCSQSSIGRSTGSPMKELEKAPKKLKGFTAP